MQKWNITDYRSPTLAARVTGHDAAWAITDDRYAVTWNAAIPAGFRRSVTSGPADLTEQLDNLGFIVEEDDPTPNVQACARRVYDVAYATWNRIRSSCDLPSIVDHWEQYRGAQAQPLAIRCLDRQRTYWTSSCPPSRWMTTWLWRHLRDNVEPTYQAFETGFLQFPVLAFPERRLIQHVTDWAHWLNHLQREGIPRSYPAFPGAQRNALALYRIVNRAMDEWLGHRDSPLLGHILQGTASRPVVTRYLIEQYHVDRQFGRLVAPLIGHDWSPTLEGLAVRYLQEEVGHEDYDLASLAALDVSAKQVEAAGLLPATDAWIEHMVLMAQQQPFLFTALVFLTEGREDDEPVIINALRAHPDWPPTVAEGLMEHFALNKEVHHGSLAKWFAKEIRYLPATLQEDIWDTLWFTLDLMYQIYDDIWAGAEASEWSEVSS